MPDPGSSPPTPRGIDRRGFFRGLLLQGLDQAEHAGRRIAASLPDFIGDSGTQAIQSSPSAPHPRKHDGATDKGLLPGIRYLRPPGALPEAAFLDACTRCGDCVRACPAQCIVVEVPDPSPHPTPHTPNPLTYPHIIARTSPCVVCEDLSCMKVCPTDALQLIQSIAAIAMGTARVDHDTCLRDTGEDCQLCITQCPLGEAAIGLDPGNAPASNARVEVRPGCIGCGVCERACPTEPASIIVEPATT